MGPRMGLVVALVLPLVTLSSLSLFAMGGGVLHQMAVAGLVIALGMLVDNAIVMVENIQWHMDRGASASGSCSQISDRTGQTSVSRDRNDPGCFCAYAHFPR